MLQRCCLASTVIVFKRFHFDYLEVTLFELCRMFKRSRVRSSHPEHNFVEIGHKVIFTAIVSLSLIQKGHLLVSGERICTKYCPGTVRLGQLTVAPMRLGYPATLKPISSLSSSSSSSSPCDSKYKKLIAVKL